MTKSQILETLKTAQVLAEASAYNAAIITAGKINFASVSVEAKTAITRYYLQLKNHKDDFYAVELRQVYLTAVGAVTVSPEKDG